MPGAVFGRGDRVTLRTVEREESEFLQRGRNDSDVGVPLGRNRPSNEQATEASIEDGEYVDVVWYGLPREELEDG